MVDMKMVRRISIIICFAMLCLSLPMSIAAAGTYRDVGPGRTYATIQAAYNAAVDGDTIRIYADGSYTGSNTVLNIQKNNLTFLGMNGRPVLDSQGPVSNGKGIWRINASGTTIDNITFKGCHDPNNLYGRNLAGIRPDDSAAGTTTIKNCLITDNDNGILVTNPIGGNGTGTDLVISNCEFYANGWGDTNGQEHNMYINHIHSFTLQYSYTHEIKGGHLIKTRCQTNKILYNRITDNSSNSTYYSNYNIDVPEGGTTWIIGNVIQQGTYVGNSGMVYYAAENTNNSGHNCWIVNNTFVNNASSGTFMLCRNDANYSVYYKNNIFTGSGSINNGGSAKWYPDHNYQGNPGYLNAGAFDYHLTSTSTGVINVGISPGTGDGFDLTPYYQYSYDCGSVSRPVNGTIDIGAFEY